MLMIFRKILVFRKFFCKKRKMSVNSGSASDVRDLEVDIDRYEKIKQIGRGGSAVVYLARDKENEDLVALKEFTIKLNKKSIKLVKREISTQIATEHPFIIKLFGYSNYEPFTIVEEYASKGTLFKYLHYSKKSRFLDATRKNIISMGIAHAMATLHSQGIIHRDLKSTNILIDEYFYPKICDFGISRSITDGEPLTCNVGAPQWMAPEVFLSGDYSYPSDVYSFGSLLYEIVSGSIPWENDDNSIEKAILRGERPEIPRNAPKSIKNLIIKCWNEDPEARPTFSEIYKLFADRKCMFDGCDDSEITFLTRKLNKVNKNQRKSYASPPKKSDSVQKPTKSVSLSETGKSPKQKPKKAQNRDFVDLDAIKNTRDFFFRPELKKASKFLLNVQSRPFFKVIQLFLMKPPMKAETICILESIQKIIQKKFHFRTFINLGLHNLLPIDSDDFVDYSLDILLEISKIQPEVLLGDFTTKYKTIVKLRPQKLIIIFAFMKDLIPDSKIEDFLLEYADNFLHSVGSCEYISLLFDLCQNKNFLPKNKDDIFDICNSSIYLHDLAAFPLVMNFLCYFAAEFEEKFNELDFESISSYLIDDDNSNATLELLLHIDEIPPIPSIISGLLFASRNDERGNLCLLKIIGLEEGARQLIKCKKWLQRDNPTIFCTLKLFLACLVHDSLIQEVKKLHDLPYFLCRLVDECDSRILTHISVIISKLEPDPEFCQILNDGGVISAVFASIDEIDSDSLEFVSFLTIVSDIARVFYSSEFIKICPRLKETIVNDNDCVPLTIAVVTVLSRYEECAKKFRELKFDKYFKSLAKDPNYKKYSQRYFKNMTANLD